MKHHKNNNQPTEFDRCVLYPARKMGGENERKEATTNLKKKQQRQKSWNRARERVVGATISQLSLRHGRLDDRPHEGKRQPKREGHDNQPKNLKKQPAKEILVASSSSSKTMMALASVAYCCFCGDPFSSCLQNTKKKAACRSTTTSQRNNQKQEKQPQTTISQQEARATVVVLKYDRPETGNQPNRCLLLRRRCHGSRQHDVPQYCTAVRCTV